MTKFTKLPLFLQAFLIIGVFCLSSVALLVIISIDSPSSSPNNKQPAAGNTATTNIKPIASYEIVGRQDLSRMGGTLVKYLYDVVAGEDISSANVKDTIDAVISQISSSDRDIDEIILNVYSQKEQVGRPFDIGYAFWGVDGKLGDVTLEMAKANDRTGYAISYKLTDNLDEFLAQKRKQEFKHGLTEQERRQINLGVASARARGLKEAEEKYPAFDKQNKPIQDNVDKANALTKELQTRYQQEFLDSKGVTEEIWRDILIESLTEKW